MRNAWVLRAAKSGFVPISSKPLLWYGLRRHEHSDRFLADTKRGSRRRRLEGRGSIGSTNPTNGGLNAAGPLFENFVGGLHKRADFAGSSSISRGEGKYHLLFDLFDGRELQMKLGESPEQPSRQVLPMSCLDGPMMILRHLEIGHPVQNPLNCYAGLGPSKRLSDA